MATNGTELLADFLYEMSETSGDHFMQAANMLRFQNERIAELERMLKHEIDDMTDHIWQGGCGK